MAESSGKNSVGKISLDLEVTSDLSKQISKVSKAIGKNLKDTMNNATKGMFDNMTNSLNKSMQLMNNSLTNSLGKMKENMKNTLINGLATLKNIKMPKIEFPKPKNDKPNTSNFTSKSTIRGPPIDTTVIKSEIENTAKALDIVNAKIDQQQAKLAGLKEQYSSTFNDSRKNALQEKILKTESAINSLIAKSDKLGFKLSDLDAKLADAGNGAGRTASKFNLLSKITKGFGSLANGTANMTKKLSSAFKGLGSSCKESNKHMNNMHSRIVNIAKQFATWMIILPIIMNGLSAMTSELMANLKTNEQFSNSLAQIKTNLMVAFTPIYQAILPAINALMSALATATTYIASFISAIFGKTYQESYKATQQLIDAKKEMGAYGDSAKKTAKEIKGLAAFDEINLLNKSGSNGDDSKVPTLTQPSLDMSQVDSKTKAWANEFKRIMGEIFKPFKEAWEREGQNTIDSMRKALTGIWDLVKAIGSSFLTVWTNGTGTQILTTTLQILQNIFNLIGKIGESFTNAWKKDDTGTKIIQNLADGFQNILDVIKGIGDVLNEVWDEKGDQIAESVTKAVLALSDNFKHLTEIIKDVWDSEGARTFKKLLELIADLVKLIADTYSQYIAPIINELADAFKPVLEQLIGFLGDIFDDLDRLVKYLNGDGHFIIDFWKQITVDPVVQAFKMAFNALAKIIKSVRNILQGLVDFIAGVFTGNWSLAWKGVKEIAEGIWQGIQDSFGVAMDFLKTRLHLTWLDSSTDTESSWSSIKEGLENKWDSLRKSASEKWESIKKSISDSCTSSQETTALKWSDIKNYIVRKWDEISTEASTKWDTIKTTISSKWDELKTKCGETWESIKTDFNNIVTFVKTNFSTGWSNAWNGVKNIFSNVFNSLVDIAKKPINAVIKMVNKLIDGLNSISIDIPDSKIFGSLAGESFGFNISNIPALAKGGIVDSPTLAMIGETRHKEAVLPLEENNGWMDVISDKAANRVVEKIGGFNNSVNTEQQGGDIIFMLDGSVIGKVALNQLRKMQKQGVIKVIPT